MFLFFQPLSKQKLLPFKAQKLPEGGFQLCVAAQFTYAAGDNKSLSVNNKGSLQWHVKLEICVLTVRNTAQGESPQETRTSISSDAQFFNHPKRKTQLENQLKSFQHQ